jgi:hypothetical protein
MDTSVTTDTTVSLTITMPDIIRQPDRKLSQPYILQKVSREIIPLLKEVLINLIWGSRF